jgi:hypothetical protein
MRALAGRLLLFLAALSTIAGTVSGAAPRSPRRVELRAVGIDLAALAPLTLATMRRELGHVLAPAGLTLDWRSAGPGDETAVGELRVIFLRSTGRGADRGTAALGRTALGIPAPSTWVYVPNVATALGFEPDEVQGSFEAQRLVGVALGRVVAHEMVHVLAPGREHASAGVMRARLSAFHLASGRPALEEDCAEALADGARAWLADRGSSVVPDPPGGRLSPSEGPAPKPGSP